MRQYKYLTLQQLRRILGAGETSRPEGGSLLVMVKSGCIG